MNFQFGFMPGKSAIDAVFSMRTSLERRYMAQLDSWALFIGFVKAFDTVPREMLLLVLGHLGFPPKIASLVM